MLHFAPSFKDLLSDTTRCYVCTNPSGGKGGRVDSRIVCASAVHSLDISYSGVSIVRASVDARTQRLLINFRDIHRHAGAVRNNMLHLSHHWNIMAPEELGFMTGSARLSVPVGAYPAINLEGVWLASLPIRLSGLTA